MTNDIIELYHMFNYQGCPNELIFGYRNDQTNPPCYYGFLYYAHDGSSVEKSPLDIKGVEQDNNPPPNNNNKNEGANNKGVYNRGLDMETYTY